MRRREENLPLGDDVDSLEPVRICRERAAFLPELSGVRNRRWKH